jgi:hypothetical protein
MPKTEYYLGYAEDGEEASEEREDVGDVVVEGCAGLEEEAAHESYGPEGRDGQSHGAQVAPWRAQLGDLQLQLDLSFRLHHANLNQMPLPSIILKDRHFKFALQLTNGVRLIQW